MHSAAGPLIDLVEMRTRTPLALSTAKAVGRSAARLLLTGAASNPRRDVQCAIEIRQPFARGNDDRRRR